MSNGLCSQAVVGYSNILSGYTEICLTKLDILSGLPEIKIGVSYTRNVRRLSQIYGSLLYFESIA
jgi:adenylosuccinate synthase